MAISTARSIEPDRIGRVKSANGPQYLAHWVLKSAQRKRMVEWYKAVLGMELVFENKLISFLTYDQEHHRLAIISLPGVAKLLVPLSKLYRKLYGIDHIAFNFGSLKELLDKYRELKEKDIEPIWCINHGPTTSIYYEDPDGNRLEFQSDNFEHPKDLQDFATGLDFHKNPIGVNFDPDYLWEKLEAGIPEAELRKRGSGTRPGRREVGGMRAITWRTL